MPFSGLPKMSISTQCLAIIAGLCVNQSAHVELDRQGLWSGADISINRSQLSVVANSDSLPFPDRRKMAKACVEGGCIYYHRHCEDKNAELICRISYNQIWWHHNRQIVVHSPSREAMEADLHSINLVIGEGAAIALNDLSTTAETELPPFCRPSTDPECN